MDAKEKEKSDIDMLVSLVQKGAINFETSPEKATKMETGTFLNPNANEFVPGSTSGYQWTEAKAMSSKKSLKKEAENFPSIPPQFANLKTEIPSISDQLKLDATILCLGGSISGPGEFYVIPVSMWNDLEAFMRKLQLAYLALICGSLDYSYADSAPNPEVLIPGMYVAVWYENEWHRGEILGKLDYNEDEQLDQNANNYVVRIIDYGYSQNAELKDIRYLMDSFTAEFPAAAFRCQLDVKNSRQEPMTKRDWNSKQCRAFFQALYDRQLQISLNDYFINDAGEKVWRVNMNILNKKDVKTEAKEFMTHEELVQYLFQKK